MLIKVEKFLMKQGNRVGKAAIEFTEGPLAGFHMLGFTICEDPDRVFVLFPAATTKQKDNETGSNRPFFFLRPATPDLLGRLEGEILDIYESMNGSFNKPRFIKGLATPEGTSVASVGA